MALCGVSLVLLVCYLIGRHFCTLFSKITKKIFFYWLFYNLILILSRKGVICLCQPKLFCTFAPPDKSSRRHKKREHFMCEPPQEQYNTIQPAAMCSLQTGFPPMLSKILGQNIKPFETLIYHFMVTAVSMVLLLCHTSWLICQIFGFTWIYLQLQTVHYTWMFLVRNNSTMVDFKSCPTHPNASFG